MTHFKTNSIFIAILLSVIIISCSQEKNNNTEQVSLEEITFASPSSQGFSVDSLAKIDEMIGKYIEKGFIPNGVVLIARHGKVVYERAIGWSSIEAQTPISKDSKFRLASMTKPITSTAIMQLYEQGKLNLQDPVSKYIPEFANPTVLTSYNAADTTWESKPAKREITIHHILTHTSGTPYGFLSKTFGAIYAKAGVPDGANHWDMSLEDKMAALGKQPLLYEPGEKWFYGLATEILGRVVEVASGMELDDYVRENITAPLGMKDTDYFFADSINHNVVSLYAPFGDTAIMEMKHKDGAPFSPDFPFRGAMKYLSGGSGMSSTARDYFIFSQTILNDGNWGNINILKASSVDAMMKNQIDTVTYPWGSNATFGYGFEVVTSNGTDARQQRTGRASWGGIHHTVFWIDKDRDIVAILLSQVFSSPNKAKINAEFEYLVNNALVDESL